MMTKEEKTAKLQEIEEQVEDFYTEDEAVALVNGILEPVVAAVPPKLRRGRVQNNLFLHGQIVAATDILYAPFWRTTGATERSFENLAAEWRFHNAAFRCTFSAALRATLTLITRAIRAGLSAP